MHVRPIHKSDQIVTIKMENGQDLYSSSYKFKTIDEAVMYYKAIGINRTDIDAVRFFAYHDIKHLLSILLSKENKPSKHDLTIIQMVTEDAENRYDMCEEREVNEILEFYKNRKES